MASTYLTVSIPYVNAAPHLGYAYELVLADVAARARRAGGPVRFLGGTDDHSLKNVLAAQAANRPTALFVAEHAARFAELRGSLAISFDDFIRTSTDPRHAPAVARLWTRVAERGDLYRRRYRGQYCVGCEQFYTDAELLDGCCPEHGVPTEPVEEENWFFRLSAYQDRLETAIASGELQIAPTAYRAEALAFVRGGLADISVSRSARRARGWGIAVPGDPEQVIWVWFDALTNYLSALDYGQANSQSYRRWWLDAAARVHVIGKGILRFHAVYWPAFLAAAGEPWPTRIQVHPYLRIDGAKISKSSGGSLDPIGLADEYGLDALRWWFARDVQPAADTDFRLDRLVERTNQDLAGGFGNTVSRITALVHRYRDGVAPDADGPVLDAVDSAIRQTNDALADFDLRRASQILLDGLGALNRDIEATAPWKLAVEPDLGGTFERVVARHLASARAIATALTPIVPDLAARLRRQLGAPGRPLPPQATAQHRLADPA